MLLQRYFRLEIQVDHEKWRALLYAISFLHSIVQERRKFGAIGWCVPYEFNNSDLDASLLFLEKHMSSTIMVGLQLSWNTIQYMVAEVQYGGRITDDLDRELFITYAAKWLVEGMFGPSFAFNTYNADYNYDIPKGRERTLKSSRHSNWERENMIRCSWVTPRKLCKSGAQTCHVVILCDICSIIFIYVLLVDVGWDGCGHVFPLEALTWATSINTSNPYRQWIHRWSLDFIQMLISPIAWRKPQRCWPPLLRRSPKIPVLVCLDLILNFELFKYFFKRISWSFVNLQCPWRRICELYIFDLGECRRWANPWTNRCRSNHRTYWIKCLKSWLKKSSGHKSTRKMV